MQKKQLLACLLAMVPTSMRAQGSRDDEIFGTEQKSEDLTTKIPGKSEQDQAKSLLDTLQIGGRLELRASSAQEEQQTFQKGSFIPSKTADIYFDTRPHEDLRVFLRTRLYEAPDKAAAAGSEVKSSSVRQDIDELWFKWDVDDAVFVSYGKQHLKWGSGTIWNPTDFTARSPKDPFALFDRRLGQELLKIHIPNEKLGFNYYAVLQLDDAERNDDIGLALRGEFAFLGTGELALSAATRRGKAQRLGLDVSSALGPIDVKLEFALSKNEDRTFYEGGLLTDEEFQLPNSYEDRSKQFKQAVAGFQYTFKYWGEDTVSLGAEYFYNELGYETRVTEIYSLLLQQSSSLYAGRRYIGGYMRLPNPGSWNKTSFFMTGLKNIADKTSSLRITGSWEIFRQANFEAYVNQCFGEYGELCFNVPSSLKQFANLPGLDPSLKTLITSLPSKRTVTVAGLGLSINF
ncbi:MAG: hypothetical protein NTX25_18860 [Proteobacteria bacterium]|nr:hypothetical protein [Pseudomonadota bacterium]